MPLRPPRWFRSCLAGLLLAGAAPVRAEDTDTLLKVGCLLSPLAVFSFLVPVPHLRLDDTWSLALAWPLRPVSIGVRTKVLGGYDLSLAVAPVLEPQYGAGKWRTAALAQISVAFGRGTDGVVFVPELGATIAGNATGTIVGAMLAYGGGDTLMWWMGLGVRRTTLGGLISYDLQLDFHFNRFFALDL